MFQWFRRKEGPYRDPPPSAGPVGEGKDVTQSLDKAPKPPPTTQAFEPSASTTSMTPLQRARETARIPVTRFEKFKVVRLIGEGGMGKVFEVTSTEDDRPYALKTLLEIGDAENRARFVREIRIGLTIDHPNVCKVVDWGMDKVGAPFLVMELLQGECLADLLQRDGPLPLEAAVELMRELLAGLGAIHEAGVVHRDLNPRNIFVTEAGDVKIMDFGIARKQDLRSLTVTGTGLGTPGFASPEQLVDIKRVDHRSDIFNAGLVFYQIMSGRLPFEEETLGGMLMQMMAADVQPLSHYVASLPPAYDEWLARMLARVPEDRFQTAQEALEALEASS